MNPQFLVSRCICHKKEFREILAEADEMGADTIEALIDHRICGTGCGLCHPYIREMLQTGQISFVSGSVPLFHSPRGNHQNS